MTDKILNSHTIVNQMDIRMEFMDLQVKYFMSSDLQDNDFEDDFDDELEDESDDFESDQMFNPKFSANLLND